VKDFGSSSAFDAGFGRPPAPVQPPPPPLPPRRESGGASKPFLVTLLLVACVCLGALLNWGLRQRAERARLFERNIEVEQSYVTVLAKRNDLASLLTDPRTHLFRLTGVGVASGRSATVAWQQETQSGVLIGDEVPLPGDDRRYALWVVDGNDRATACGTFRPEAGVTYYDFRATGAGGEVKGFRVTEESDARPAAPGGAMVYETR
jgi:hypothetical protein